MQSSDEHSAIIVFATRLGDFAIEASDQAVTRLLFPCHIPPGLVGDATPPALLEQAEKEVHEYLDGQRTEFTVPLAPSGSDFMLAVWARLLDIGFGETMTYGDVAKALGNPGASRAVGLACKRNPIPLFIPCHRVLGTAGKLTGFSGGGLSMKQTLLHHESRNLFTRGR